MMVSASVHSLRGFLSTLAVRLNHLSWYLWSQHRRTAASHTTQTRLGACSQTVWPRSREREVCGAGRVCTTSKGGVARHASHRLVKPAKKLETIEGWKYDAERPHAALAALPPQ
ncbi:unnamed protein product [Cercospora beticola]|nr:unnamed protein product [Cercospora beticola]